MEVAVHFIPTLQMAWDFSKASIPHNVWFLLFSSHQKVMEWLGVSSVSLSRLNIKPEDSRQCTNANAGGKAVIQAFLNRYIFIESGWSWGLGFGFPKIFGKRFSGSPSPYKHTYIYNLRLLSLYEYVFLGQGHFIVLEAAISHSDGFEQDN